jgi:hypothetical protein
VLYGEGEKGLRMQLLTIIHEVAELKESKICNETYQVTIKLNGQKPLFSYFLTECQYAITLGKAESLLYQRFPSVSFLFALHDFCQKCLFLFFAVLGTDSCTERTYENLKGPSKHAEH